MANPLTRFAQLFAARRATERRDPDEHRVSYTGRTLAGVVITPDTAVQIATVWACLRYLSQTVGMLPWNVMVPAERGAEVASKTPIQRLINKRPNPEWSSMQFRETMVHWALRWGNGYAELERDMSGRPFALWPIHPERVDPQRDLAGRLQYKVDNGAGNSAFIPSEDMFHLRGFGEGVVGLNVMDYAAQSLGWAKAVQLFGAAFFGNGANLGGVVTSKKKFEPGPLARIKLEFGKLYKGVSNANKTAFLDNDMEWKATGVEPLKAQMIEANYFLIEEICRWFGVPPHKVAHLLRATFSNIEHQSIEVVQDSILPWVRRLEDEADYKLFGQNNAGLFTKIELRGMLRGDFKTQQEGFEIMRRNGALNAEEWRAFIDMGPMPDGAGGDKYTMQSQYTELKKVGIAPPKAAPKPPLDPAQGDAQAPNGPDEATMAALNTLADHLEAEHV